MTLIASAELQELAFRLCMSTEPVPGHALLLDALRREGGPDFAPRLSRGGWYRPGRIIDRDGRCVADDALGWLEAAWEDAGEDGEALAERLRTQGYHLTREQGTSHYLVAIRGKAPTDYLQLEIEVLQEVISHPLGGCNRPADSVEALLERPAGLPPPQPLGKPRYNCRRLTDISAYIARIANQPGSRAPVLRFLDDWARASAGQHRHFCDHWVLALAEHLDRYRQIRYGAVPVAAHTPTWTGHDNARGTALAQQLHDFDCAAGYGFAWYFHMVSGRRVPRTIPALVYADLNDGLAYLPQRDIALVNDWVRTPYSI